MMKHKKYLAKLIVFTILACYCLSAVNEILIPKYFYNAEWGTTSTYMDFYNMKEDTIDVLFLGSSHCAAAFSPIELYEKYGIKSYNLGCEQQNMLLSYYWLEEALRFQSPGYVFLDTFMLFPYDEQEPLNTSEATTRKAMDFMRWSNVKMKAVHDICRIDKEQKQSAYFFPNIRFHERWKYLTENDFSVSTMKNHVSLMGFYPLDFTCGDESFRPYSREEQAGYQEMVPVMKEYLDKMVMLCAEHNVELVLVKSPTMFYSGQAACSVRAYAEKNGLEYIDFNEESIYHAAGIDFAEDSCDTDHVNISGAMKLSDYMGEWLLEKMPGGCQDEQWEIRRLFYQQYLRDRS